jgi:hypothetical protein
MSEQDRTVDQVEAAAILGVMPRTLEAWRQARRGPTFIRYSARAVRYRVADLLDYQKQFTVSTSAAE